MRLDTAEIEQLIAFTQHEVNCEQRESCTTCEEFRVGARAMFAVAADREQSEQALIVEEILGANGKRISRKCAGCGGNTILRCKHCRVPCCQSCASRTGAHSHIVRLKDDAPLTYPEVEWFELDNVTEEQRRKGWAAYHGQRPTGRHHTYKIGRRNLFRGMTLSISAKDSIPHQFELVR